MSSADKLIIPKRTVIIGSRGFVGSHIAAKAKSLAWPIVELSSAQVDLTSESSISLLTQIIQKDDSVIFVSALTPDKGRDRATLIKNISMAHNVCCALEKSKCAHLAYISSDAVYSDAAHLISESSHCDPASFHGVMHLARERMLQDMAKQSAIALLLLRPCAVYGSADTHNSYGPNRFMRTAIKEREIKISGEGEERRDHIYIDDLVTAVCMLVSMQSVGVLNLASGKSVSFGQVAHCVAKLVGEDVRIVKQPRQNPITHRHFDITARITALPKLRFTELSEGLTQILKRAIA